MEGAPLAMLLSQAATKRLVESGGPHGPVEQPRRRRGHRTAPLGDRAARVLRRMADGIERRTGGELACEESTLSPAC
jgi:hypothetical protein